MTSSNLKKITTTLPRSGVDSFGHSVGFGCLLSSRGVGCKLLLVMVRKEIKKRLD